MRGTNLLLTVGLEGFPSSSMVKNEHAVQEMWV